MTDESTTKNVNNAYDHIFFFFFFFTLPERELIFYTKQKYITVRYVNKSYDIIYGKRFVIKKTYYIVGHRLG